MKERPILMNGEMVKQTLADIKTQTRRVVKDKYLKSYPLGNDFKIQICSHTWMGKRVGQSCPDCYKALLLKCPYGQIGDMLWVRETLAISQYEGADDTFSYIEYDATAGNDNNYVKHHGTQMFWQWKNKKLPSIHMPRWASRITLEITNVRVERLNDISEENAKAEGIRRLDVADGYHNYRLKENENRIGFYYAKDSFESLWRSINGKGSWEANPWVWVIEFKVVK